LYHNRLTWLSRPTMNIIMKKRTDHTWPTGSLARAAG
jgi:hypothetical protein